MDFFINGRNCCQFAHMRLKFGIFLTMTFFSLNKGTPIEGTPILKLAMVKRL